MSIQHDIAKVKEQRAKALNQQVALLNGKQTSESKRLYDTLQNDVEGYDSTISMLLQIAENVSDGDLRDAAQQADETRAALGNLPSAVVAEFSRIVATPSKSQFETYKRGLLHPSTLTAKEQQEYRDITTPTTNGGKDLISQAYSKVIQTASRVYGPIASLVNIVPASFVKLPQADATGIQYKLVVTEGSTDVALPASDGSNAYSQTPSVWSSVNQVNSIVATVNTSKQLFEDAESLEAFLTNTVFAEALAASVESVLTTGNDLTGTAIPSAASSLIANSATGATTASLAAGISYFDFISLFESMTYSYVNPENPNARVFLHPSTLLYLQGLKDTAGRSFFTYDGQGRLAAIAGVKVEINNSLPVYNFASPVAGQVVAVAGDIKKSLNYVQGSSNLHILRERFLDQNMLSFVSEHRLGVTAGIVGATKKLVLAAS